ncbi:hypothetical protein JM64_03735 [Fervidobacterium ngatamarikiense]|uniref:Restriction system protein Mrr-like N-terminal domain-containing protein n=1 Tax=Fervidobacterium pennivorans TaxID=93466 RepID=A0A172T2X5_FERPE|nr:winged helix-turn-helix domain-containing protein [Fervidobacterium pennivorans]ANE41193.1 hypothetical protein JM64_03735 [Fervidobacterium pennivorans]
MNNKINVREGVNIAFEMLEEEIGKIVNNLAKSIAEVSKKQDFERTKKLIDIAQRIKEYKNRLIAFKEEWRKIIGNEKAIITRIEISSQNGSSEAREQAPRELKQNNKTGMRTPEREFIIPILESLIELDGKGKVSEVLKLVFERMKNKLKTYDLEKIPAGEIRWRNTARWARKMMIKEGLLEPNSPNGIWEITDKGREYYLQHVEKLKSNNSVRQTSE